MEVGEEYLLLHCHHQNDFCIKVDSDESFFKCFSRKRKESRSGIGPRSFRLPA